MATISTARVNVSFAADKKIKAAAMKKAIRQGLTLSAVLNRSLRSYVTAKANDIADPLTRDIAKARVQKSISSAEMRRMLGV